jgi:RND family efflux transporter MFP subunit
MFDTEETTLGSGARRNWKLGWMAGLALIVSVAGCHSGGGGAADAKPDAGDAAAATVEVTKATAQAMETTVHAQGTLAPGQGAVAHVAAPVAGRLQAVSVREGEPVVAGQIVALLDNRQQKAQANSAAAALAAAQALAQESDTTARAAALDQNSAVRIARLALESAVADRNSSVLQAQNALAAARTDLQRVRSGARPQEIAQADQTVRQDQATLDRARTELDRITSLFNNGIAARRQLDDAQTAVTVAETGLESAKQQASLLRAGARPEEVHTAELAVQQAQNALTAAERSGDLKVSQAGASLRQANQAALQVRAKQQDVVVQRRNAAQKMADYNSAQAAASFTVVRAPLSGVVTRRASNPGDLADPATPILDITDTHALNLAAELPAEDGLKVRAGMEAHVSLPDVPGKTFEGRVLSVGQVDPQTNLLAVRVAVPNPQGRLKSGTFATADIVVRSDPHAVVVPKSAVVNHEGGSVVFVVGADNVAHQHDVDLGAQQNGLVEILKGVSAGDPVITLGQYELADGAKVQVAPHAEESADHADEGGAHAEGAAPGGEGGGHAEGTPNEAPAPAGEGAAHSGGDHADAAGGPTAKPEKADSSKP